MEQVAVQINGFEEVPQPARGELLAEVGLRVLREVQSNIAAARSGTGGSYPLTTFPSGSTPRIPFKNKIDEWHIEATPNEVTVRPTSFWWDIHARGAVIRAIRAKVLALRCRTGTFFAQRVILPPRNPSPSLDRVASIAQGVLHEALISGRLDLEAEET